MQGQGHIELNGYTKEATEGIVVIARMVAPEGKREELLDLLSEMVAAMAEHEPDGPLVTVTPSSRGRWKYSSRRLQR